MLHHLSIVLGWRSTRNPASVAALFVVLFSALFAASSMVQADTYYVASTVGQRIQLVVQDFASETTPIDHSKRAFGEFANEHFNSQIMGAMRAELLRADPKAEVLGLKINDSSILPADDAYDDAESVERFVQALSKGTSFEPHAKLVLMVPWKSRVLMRYDSSEKTGKNVEGFGFYIDPDAHGDNGDYLTDASAMATDGATKGALAVFANVRLVMIDLNQGTVLSMQTFRSSDYYSAVHSTSLDILDSATPEQKKASLVALVQQGVQKTIPELIKLKGTVNVKRVD